MRIAFYPSFRALDHDRSSGLVSIAKDIFSAMKSEGHETFIPVHQSMEWIYLRPHLWLSTLKDAWQGDKTLKTAKADCWLTYHTYYRGPDLIGPLLSGRNDLPYFILAGSYATKYRKQLKTWLGFHLNKRALLRADMVFINKRRDRENLLRLLPPERITYIRPGISTQAFPLDSTLRHNMRTQLGLQDKRVVVTAAMMRPGVKEEGIAFVIDACAAIRSDMSDMHLLIAGDGAGRARLEEQALRLLPGAHSFVGRVPAAAMANIYNAGDIFAFPGINESLGMVYLEAQCCGLPVVATSHDGAPEVVADQETGIIVPPFSLPAFADALRTLLGDSQMRSQFSLRAREKVIRQYDMTINYQEMFEVMAHVCAERRS